MKAFLCFFAAYIGMHLWFKAPSCTMPTLTGLQLAQATKLCSDLHLRIEITQTKEDRTHPEGTVIHQIPAPGRAIKERQTVFLSLTAQPAAATAPDLLNLDQDEATACCSRLNLKAKHYTLAFPYTPGTCFAQWPAPGQPITDNTVMCYIAAQEEAHALWPNFKGQRLSDVLDALAPYAIPVRTHRTATPGRTYYIIDQQPKAGAYIDMHRPDEITAYFQISTKRP